MLTLTVAIGWFGFLRLIRSVRQTTLVAAAWWSLWFQLTLTIAAIATIARQFVVPLAGPVIAPGLVDQLWYLTAVSALCPLVAVLGARRGRIIDWSLFVLLPLIAVLEWPALVQWRRCWNGQRLELEAPSLIAFALVLIMGAGNYVGTRFTRPAIVWIVTWSLIVWTFSSPLGQNRLPREPVYSYLTISLLIFWTAITKAITRKSQVTGWDKVWQDYRHRFGTVWSFRLMTRVNEVAHREQWPWVLTTDGFRLVSLGLEYPGEPTSDKRVDQTMRWLLKQFVDPEWIDERLGTDAAANGL
jgi:lysylphosphatidylglycerol synthetase-like protein (DUF2156 family)